MKLCQDPEDNEYEKNKNKSFDGKKKEILRKKNFDEIIDPKTQDIYSQTIKLKGNAKTHLSKILDLPQKTFYTLQEN